MRAPIERLIGELEAPLKKCPICERDGHRYGKFCAECEFVTDFAQRQPQAFLRIADATVSAMGFADDI